MNISACSIQQKEVPDQTALVWRTDLYRFDQDLIIAEARLNNSRDQISLLEKQLLDMREALKGYLSRCPDCAGNGSYPYGLTDNPEQVQCQWCDTGLMALSRIPSSISSKWVDREVVQRDLVIAILSVHYTRKFLESPSGNPIIAKAITLARQALGEKK